MIHEVIPASEFAPQVADSTARLMTYARPQEGFLGEKDGRWAVLILPGGGYQICAASEGEPVALAFLGAGVQAFLLEYSVSPARWPQALLETASAVAWLRSNALTYGISPEKIAVCGFSAGGHLAGCLANLYHIPLVTAPLKLTGVQTRPDAAILCYPVITMEEPSSTRNTLFQNMNVVPEASLEKSVSALNPPSFLWATFTDNSVPVRNCLLYADALYEHSILYEMHIFDKGPHAMSLASEDSVWETDRVSERVGNWFPLCVSWLKNLK